MDHADSSLAGSIEPLHDSVAGTDAGPGESFAMTTWNATTSMGRGRDTLPLHPIPKTKPGRLHKSLDTPEKLPALFPFARTARNVCGLLLLPWPSPLPGGPSAPQQSRAARLIVCTDVDYALLVFAHRAFCARLIFLRAAADRVRRWPPNFELPNATSAAP